MRLHYTIHTEMKMGKWTTQKESYWFFVIFRYKKLRKENISRDVPYYVPPLHQPYWLFSKTASRWIKRDHLIRVYIKIRYLKQICLYFEFSAPYLQDKRAGISNLFQSLIPIFIHTQRLHPLSPVFIYLRYRWPVDFWKYLTF